MIQVIRSRATPEQMDRMLAEHKFYIKLAVDIERRILAGGGEMHYFCEQALLDDGSSQKNIWGAGFMPLNSPPIEIGVLSSGLPPTWISIKLLS